MGTKRKPSNKKCNECGAVAILSGPKEVRCFADWRGCCGTMEAF